MGAGAIGQERGKERSGTEKSATQGGATLVSVAEKGDAKVEVKPPIVLSSRTKTTLNVDYGAKGEPLEKLDIYAPVGAELAPVFVFVHGGGWNKRDKDEVGAQPKLFNDAGILVVSINYRLVPAVQHPENVRDVAAAIAWMKQNISKYGGDPQKIVLMGHSAGSHLVSLVATDDRYLAAHGLHRNSLAGVISLDGSAFDIPDRMKNGAATIAENCRRAFGERLEDQLDGSPVQHVKGNVPLPPFYLVYLNPDSLNQRQSTRFAELVRAAGGQATVKHMSDGKTHQALCDDLGTEDDHTGRLLVEFVQSVTRGK